MHDLLTTSEVADYLRIKERKIYDLVARKEIPFSRVTGKLLFPRVAIARWLEQNSDYGAMRGAFRPRPPIVAGSHDPLLEWALRASGSGLAVFFDGSGNGLERLSRGEAVGAGIHLPDAAVSEWNIDAVRDALGLEPIVVIEWAKRVQGLVVAQGNPHGIAGLADLRGRSFIQRQEGSGSRALFSALLAKEPGLAEAMTVIEEPALSEADVAHAIASGRADAGVAIEAAARQYRLGFVPIVRERYDLVVWRKDYFEPPFQKLLSFCRSAEMRRRADELGGYDVSGFGTVHYNGP